MMAAVGQVQVAAPQRIADRQGEADFPQPPINGAAPPFLTLAASPPARCPRWERLPAKDDCGPGSFPAAADA